MRRSRISCLQQAGMLQARQHHETLIGLVILGSNLSVYASGHVDPKYFDLLNPTFGIRARLCPDLESLSDPRSNSWSF
jgi:hypothetical protein